MMRKILILIIVMLTLPFSGCTQRQNAQIVATTKPVYDFTSALCQGTPVTVTQLVTENVSCLHDYTLQVDQMRAIESAELVILSGAGLEDFLTDALQNAAAVLDSSDGITPECGEHEHGKDNHNHVFDPHIWLSISNARTMANNIYTELISRYPQHLEVFTANMAVLNAEFDKLDVYGRETLSSLSSKKIITFHDGFSYFADYWGLEILHALEEESGSEASAGELKELINLVKANNLKAIFTEENGSTSAANTVAAETEIQVYPLTMGMSDKDYFEAMYHNIDTIKEALG